MANAKYAEYDEMGNPIDDTPEPVICDCGAWVVWLESGVVAEADEDIEHECDYSDDIDEDDYVTRELGGLDEDNGSDR